MDNKFKLIIDSFGHDKFKFDEPISNYSALNVGGPAKLFFIAFTTGELVKIIKMCRDLRLPYFLFGTGTKMMISDQGFLGLVIKNRTKNIQTISVKGKVSRFGVGVEEALIEVDSGVSLGKFAEELERQNLSAESFKGIPGSIGGNLLVSTVLQKLVKSIKVLGQGSEIGEINSESLSFKKHIILSAVFKIKAKE
ncbi:FAD-binding protein [Candidatus Daviesbacteria bacterium]|nr:FAD-binding protein [Candidatus Daviesbacteria bacterium]